MTTDPVSLDASIIDVSIIDVIAPVTEVTVLEDRAHVVRTGRVVLPAGRCQVRFSGVAPVLSDKTAIATIAGPAAVAVQRLVVARLRLTRASELPQATAALREQHRVLELEMARLDERRRQTEVAWEKTGRALTATITEVGEDASWGRDGREDWRNSLDSLHQRERSLALARVALKADSHELQLRIIDLATRLDAAPSPRHGMSAAITCDLDVAATGEYAIRLAYLVPSACWRPQHAARLSEGGPVQLEFATAACVWQNTGEDWTGVRLRVSTARPSLGSAPAHLTSDVLTLRRKDAGIQVEVREQTVQTTGGAAGKPDAAAAPAEAMLGIDDGGEAQLLTCPGLATIPSDGLPHRAPLAAFTAPVETALVVMAEISPAAILRSTQANLGARPLLAGPVDLIRRGGICGRADILYVAPGAAFDLGWGPEGDLRIQRETTEIAEKTPVSSFFTGWTSTLHRVDLRLSNLADGPRTVTVSERIPVSSLDQVRIELDEATAPPALPTTTASCAGRSPCPPAPTAKSPSATTCAATPTSSASDPATLGTEPAGICVGYGFNYAERIFLRAPASTAMIRQPGSVNPLHSNRNRGLHPTHLLPQLSPRNQ